MAGEIFISYRRDDEPFAAKALYLELEKRFSTNNIFMDVEGGIPPGQDFAEVLRDRVAKCDIMLAVIGKKWISAVDSLGRRRLDNPNDYVRFEIEEALRLRKLVIPVLVNDADMPRPTDIPPSMDDFIRLQAVSFSLKRANTDPQAIAEVIRENLPKLKAAQTAGRPSQPIQDEINRQLVAATQPLQTEISRLRWTLEDVNTLLIPLGAALATGLFWFYLDPRPVSLYMSLPGGFIGYLITSVARGSASTVPQQEFRERALLVGLVAYIAFLLIRAGAMSGHN
jgi:hypothetical protein